jgi:hypothetical protein
MIFIRVLCPLLLAWLSVAPAAAAVLYDGGRGSHPSAQGWAYLTSPFFGAAADRYLEPGGSALDTRDNRSDSAGHFLGYLGTPGLPSFDRQNGFILDFSLRIDDENHDSRDDNGDGLYDRAGYSLLLVTSDLRALELGFFDDRVWAYEDNRGTKSAFTQAEGFAVATDQLRDYSLTIQGEGYSLAIDGLGVLSGPLRNYTFFAGFPDPYETRNLLFMGDDTSSAESRSFLAAVSIQPLPVPLPPAWALLASGLWLTGRRRHVTPAVSNPS